MLKIGGTIRLEGQSLKRIEKQKGGGAKAWFEDAGSCEAFFVFSPENFRRIAEAAVRFVGGKENEIDFKADKSGIVADDLQIMIEDQAVKFKVPEPDDNDILTIIIQPTSGKDDIYSGLAITLNEAQAAELVKRLGMFLEAAKLRRDASKTKTIAAPARTKRIGAGVSA